MNVRVLWADDELSLIQSMKRHLRGEFDIVEACNGMQALDVLGSSTEPFSVIVSDQRMPGMDGIELLHRIKDLAPDTVRVMLTGYADQHTAIEAVNQGHIFRFLTKPCAPLTIQRTLRDAHRQHELITAERELLEKTLAGSIQVMADILALANPVAFRRATVVSDIAGAVARLMRLPDPWQITAAGTLSHLGYITLPAEVLEHFYAGRNLSSAEEAMMNGQVESTARLLGKIPRMEPVVRIIAEHTTSRNTPAVRAADPIALSAHILRCTIEFDRMISRGITRAEAIRFLSGNQDDYNPEVVAHISSARNLKREGQRSMIMIDSLQIGMTVDEDVRTASGVLLVPKGYVINETVRQRLRNFRLSDEIDPSVAVLLDG